MQTVDDPLTRLNNHIGFEARAGNPFAGLGVNHPNMVLLFLYF